MIPPVPLAINQKRLPIARGVSLVVNLHNGGGVERTT